MVHAQEMGDYTSIWATRTGKEERFAKELLLLSSLFLLYQWDQVTFWLLVSRKSQSHTETLKCGPDLREQAELKVKGDCFAPGLDSISNTQKNFPTCIKRQ